MIVDFDAHQVDQFLLGCMISCALPTYILHYLPNFPLLFDLLTQGNGHERDFMEDERVYIMDMYNRWIYPNDMRAKGSGTLSFSLSLSPFVPPSFLKIDSFFPSFYCVIVTSW